MGRGVTWGQQALDAAAKKRGNVQPYQHTASGGPYQYGLNTNVQAYSGAGAEDSDVREVQQLINDNEDARTLSTAGWGHGVDFAKNNARIAAAQARINLKNQLGSSIANNKNMAGAAVEGIRDSAQSASDLGVKNTRKNYNSRGLLYSGMREGGEQGVKSAVAGGLAGDLAGNKSDYENLLKQQQQAYTSIGLQQQKEQVDLANTAFETATRNSIARQQAYQQLGAGVGYLGGSMAGGGGTTSRANPNDYGAINSSTLTQPELGSSARSYGYR